MNCSQARQWISPYLDSELDRSTTFEVSRHLEACSACRERFEREAQAEQLIAEQLGRFEPFVDWPALEKAVASNANAGVKRLRPRWMLAVAACLAFVIIGLSDWSRSTSAHPTQWAVDELHRLAPNGLPFVHAPHCSHDDLRQLAEQVVQHPLDLPMKQAHAGGHDLQLIQALSRGGTGRVSRLQVHLNCCDQPVLLTIGHRDGGTEFQQISRVLEHHPDHMLVHTINAHDKAYNICARLVGDYVMLAVSAHEVSGLVTGSTLQGM